jgi:hypothetical protein
LQVGTTMEQLPGSCLKLYLIPCPCPVEFGASLLHTPANDLHDWAGPALVGLRVRWEPHIPPAITAVRSHMSACRSRVNGHPPGPVTTRARGRGRGWHTCTRWPPQWMPFYCSNPPERAIMCSAGGLLESAAVCQVQVTAVCQSLDQSAAMGRMGRLPSVVGGL